MPSWRVTAAAVLLVVAAFGIAFGTARLFRGSGGTAPAARPQVVHVAHTRVAVFGPAARLPELRSP
jgi:hypothetical protein